MKALPDNLIPEFSVYPGTTSVDVKPGIDKAGGNDYPAKEAGVLSIQVRDPDESKRVIEAILACLGSESR